MKKLKFKISERHIDAAGNWNTAKDFFPIINVDQKKKNVEIIKISTNGYQKKATGSTDSCNVKTSKDGQAILIVGKSSCKNWQHSKCSGEQGFVFCVFVGDSGHIYTHRAPATKGWINCDPEKILGKLRKLGIGVENPAYQQGDFLLKKANGNAYSDEEFKHETMGAGHHKFLAPVLFADGRKGRQYKITESIMLRHEAVDGIRHPDVIVNPGTYIVGTTANSLFHTNKRD